MDQATINDLLVKKNQGVAFTSTAFTAAGENAGSALPIILNSNVQGEIIPAVAPTLSSYIDLPDASGASGIDVNGGKIYDTDVNYIKYYEKVLLEEKVFNKAYSYPGTILTDFRNTNKLVNAVPGNTDPAGSYAIKVYAENGTDSFTSDSPLRPWLFDNASGYLTFFNGWNKSSLGLPRISYYRYEGKMGAVSDTIDGDLAVTGNVGIGTTNPLGNLHVFNTAESKIIIDRDPGNDGTNYVPVGTSVGGIHFRSADFSWTTQKTGASIEAFPGNIGYSGSCHDIRFRTLSSNTSTSLSDRMTIRYNGNVGIGYTNPPKLLTLSGNGTDSNCILELGCGASGNGNGATMRWRHSVYTDGSPQYFYAGLHDGWYYPKWVLSCAGGRAIEVENNAQVILEGSAYSDDRLKKNEAYITNALNTLLKLKPQIYDKHIQNFESETFEITDNYKKESGIIAQEVFYDAPELRHLIHIHPSVNVEDVSNNSVPTSDDPQIDPDYSNWGPRAATVNYTGFIAYLIKGIQEQQDIIQEEKAKTAVLENQLADVLNRLSMLENN